MTAEGWGDDRDDKSAVVGGRVRSVRELREVLWPNSILST